MKKLLLILFVPFSLCAQQDSSHFTPVTKNCSFDLDIGMEWMRIESPHFSPNIFFNHDSIPHQSFLGYEGGIFFYRRVVYIEPLWSVGFFVKPFFGSNMHRHSFAKSWLGLQLPVGIATEFGKTDEHSPGMMIGAAIDLNVFDFGDYHVPAFYRPLPYFFIQVHEGVYGLRFSGSPDHAYLNKDGTTTRTSFSFELAIIFTGRF